MKTKITTEEFIRRSTAVHGNKYDYSKSIYVKASEKVLIICPIHGEFKQTPGMHCGKQEQGCPQCGLEKLVALGSKKSIGLDEFIRRSNIVHGNKYDYSKSIYQSLNKPVTVICPEHGEFYPTPWNHSHNNTGCPKCAITERNNNLKLSHEQFIERATRIHGNKYDYIESENYKNDRTSITVVCPKHGEFRQCRNSHMLGKGCQKCAVDLSSINLRIPFEEFVRRANETYDNKYSYVKESYTAIKEKVDVICPEHGMFTVNAESHVCGSKCKKCKLNGFEKSILDFVSTITNKDISLFVDDVIDGYELDIKIGDNLAIECNGDYWHSYNRKESSKEKNKHYYKHDLCLEKNIKLVQISESEWNYKREIVKSILSNALNLSNRIYARKCSIVTLSNNDTIEFLNNNHIQGHRSALVSYGLKYQDKIVSIMSASRHHKYQYELMRYACDLNHIVVGGLSKLFNRFKSEYDPKTMVSYADRRYFTGKSYEHAGFKLDGVSSPNYKYVKGIVTLSRQKCQKHKLHKFLNIYNDDLTESENMFMNGYRRLWDAGNWRYVYNQP